jgi:hypothetical protein
MTIEEKAKISQSVAEMISALLVELHDTRGWPVDAIVAGIQAEGALLLAGLIGGPAAADQLERAANMVRNQPSAATLALCYSPPAGSA